MAYLKGTTLSGGTAPSRTVKKVAAPKPAAIVQTAPKVSAPVSRTSVPPRVNTQSRQIPPTVTALKPPVLVGGAQKAIQAAPPKTVSKTNKSKHPDAAVSTPKPAPVPRRIGQLKQMRQMRTEARYAGGSPSMGVASPGPVAAPASAARGTSAAGGYESLAKKRLKKRNIS